MSDLSIFKLDTQTINIKDTTARQTADSAKTLATTASGNATTALNKINELESEKADTIISSTSGAIASFPDGAESTAKKLVVGIEPVQDLHGYDNPWPGGGTKNKMPNAIPKTETINGITFKLDDFGVFTVTGTATSEASCDFPIGFSFVILDGDPKPIFALNNTQSTSALFRFFNGNVQVDSWIITPVNRTQEYTNMQGKTCNSYRITVPSGTTVNVTLSPMIVENSVTDYTYIPYSNICPISGWTGAEVTVNEDVLDIAFPSEAGTVYGGTLDVTTGVLTVDRASVDLGALDWSYYSDSSTEFFTTSSLSTLIKSTGNNDRMNGYCSVFDVRALWGDNFSSLDCVIAATGTNLRARWLAFTNASEFIAAVTGQILIYPLATPVAYRLTPQEITTLLGQNNIWADTGDTSVTYRADTKLYIDNKFTELQALIIENLEVSINYDSTKENMTITIGTHSAA